MKLPKFKIEVSFLRSKVAKRIFFLFVLCALLPVSALAYFSFSQVTKQLTHQANRRLYQASKATGMAIFERLMFLETDLKMIISNLQMLSTDTLESATHGFHERLKIHFKGLVLVTGSGHNIASLGPIQTLPQLSNNEQQHINSGKTLVLVRPNPDNFANIFMAKVLEPAQPDQKILFGEINPGYLWAEEFLSKIIKLYVVDQSTNVLFSSFLERIPLQELKDAMVEGAPSGRFEWTYEDDKYLASYRTLFLYTKFFTPKWTIVQNQSRIEILAPMQYFKKFFLLVILLSFWVVLLLSLSQIRRNLVPIELLREATKKIAAKDFGKRVKIKSKDEFEELGESFNEMANSLESHLKIMTTINQIDRAILSSLDQGQIVSTVLTSVGDFLPCHVASLLLVDSESTGMTLATVHPDNKTYSQEDRPVPLNPKDLEGLAYGQESYIYIEDLDSDKETYPYLAWIDKEGAKSLLVLPLLIKNELAGIMTLGRVDRSAFSEEDLENARTLADQVAVALSNAQLIEELDQLNWGTLTALARAIDEKSSWTAGHSERVTDLAIKIGRMMEFTPEELDNLHRGGLLHDIGKIGVPAAILDKPGRLTDEEFALIREHPGKGGRILEPITEYASIIPIVVHHHERFDGKGYPSGLAGQDINLGARILAIADTFDAITSDRPYRNGMATERAIQIIKEEDGRQFDPEVVQAFLCVMA